MNIKERQKKTIRQFERKRKTRQCLMMMLVRMMARKKRKRTILVMMTVRIMKPFCQNLMTMGT